MTHLLTASSLALWLVTPVFFGMASPATTTFNSQARAEAESDYGSEFSPEEEDIVSRLLVANPEPQATEDNPVVTDVEYHDPAQTTRVPRVLGRERRHETVGDDKIASSGAGVPVKTVNQSYPDLSHIQRTSLPPGGSIEPNAPKDEARDPRSPIERFRTAPMKSLSVTDLVSPAWCELQYWYSLKTHGQKKQTKAMKHGSVVHKELEDQMYETVKINIATKEDAWGLRIWNVIQGLRTLQEIGQTRELEVWGIIDGVLVNGVIDEVSFTCPDTELEAEIQNMGKSSKDELPPNQTTISDFFNVSGGTCIADATRIKQQSPSKKLYICDVKTRSIRSLPRGVAFRPTKVQLMLYHHLLGNLVTNKVDFSIVLNRYSLDGEKPFSDSFIAQIGSLNVYDALPNDPILESGELSSQDSMTILLEHNSLSRLWSLMIRSFQHVLPDGKDSIGNILKAEYRSRDDGEILGVTTLPMDESILKVYLEHEMKWWKGEREPVGVVIEEAYKCKSCEFAENCEWRLERVGEAREKARANKKALGEAKKWEV